MIFGEKPNWAFYNMTQLANCEILSAETSLPLAVYYNYGEDCYCGGITSRIFLWLPRTEITSEYVIYSVDSHKLYDDGTSVVVITAQIKLDCRQYLIDDGQTQEIINYLTYSGFITVTGSCPKWGDPNTISSCSKSIIGAGTDSI